VPAFKPTIVSWPVAGGQRARQAERKMLASLTIGLLRAGAAIDRYRVTLD
jgi:hypothetical protein